MDKTQEILQRVKARASRTYEFNSQNPQVNDRLLSNVPEGRLAAESDLNSIDISRSNNVSIEKLEIKETTITNPQSVENLVNLNIEIKDSLSNAINHLSEQNMAIASQQQLALIPKPRILPQIHNINRGQIVVGNPQPLDIKVNASLPKPTPDNLVEFFDQLSVEDKRVAVNVSNMPSNPLTALKEAAVGAKEAADTTVELVKTIFIYTGVSIGTAITLAIAYKSGIHKLTYYAAKKVYDSVPTYNSDNLENSISAVGSNSDFKVRLLEHFKDIMQQ